MNEVPNALPPDDMREAWIQQNAAPLRRAISEPETHSRIIALLTGDEQERRKRRLSALAEELDGMELTLRLRSDGENG
jgi:hypothetical protein